MSPKKSEADRARAQTVTLASHYRAIGPAAIVAALLCASKKKTPAPTISRKAA